MNERIRELKEQAMRFAQEKCEGQSRDIYGTLRADIMTEKFAELIVRECAEVASDWDGAHYVGTAIEKHFGVEE
jgi:hypothetical protein